MIKYYMRPDSNNPPQYSYVVGLDTDILWDKKTCIEVPPCPSSNYDYDMTEKEWKLNATAYMANLRAIRDSALKETDKYMLGDYPISTEDRKIILIYRQELRDCPNKKDIKDRKMPKKLKVKNANG